MKYKHKKTGHICQHIGTACIQTSIPLLDMDEVEIYTHDGKLWVRRRDEFWDGRFIQIDE